MFKNKYEQKEQELEMEIERDKQEAKKEVPEESPQISLLKGVGVDEFDIEREFVSEFEEIVEQKNRKGIELSYSFNGTEITEALKIFQRETIYKRNYIYTGILAVVFILYMFGIAKNADPMSIFLAMMCVAVICFIWYMPKQHIKKTAHAADTHELHFVMEVFDDSVKIGEEEGSFTMNYNKEITKIIETVGLFLLCCGKERVFIVPKRFLEDGITTQVKEVFMEGMKENYIKKIT